MLGIVLEERSIESGFMDYRTADGSGGLFTERVEYALSMVEVGDATPRDLSTGAGRHGGRSVNCEKGENKVGIELNA